MVGEDRGQFAMHGRLGIAAVESELVMMTRNPSVGIAPSLFVFLSGWVWA